MKNQSTAVTPTLAHDSFWVRHRTLKWVVTLLAGLVFVLAFVAYLASNLGVNFYLNGDLLRVVDELNGVAKPRS